MHRYASDMQKCLKLIIGSSKGLIMQSITILMTGAGAPGAPSIIKCLRKNGEREIRIVGVDANAAANGRKLVDVFYQVPPAMDKAFIDVIIELCRKENVRIVVPLVTRELMKFALAKDAFSSIGVKVSVMDACVLGIVNDKANLLQKVKSLGLPTPDFTICNNLDEVRDGCRKLGYPDKPVVVKGAEGNGSRGVRIVDSRKSMYDLFFNEKPTSMYMSYHDVLCALGERDTLPKMLVMEYLPGEEYGVDALCVNGEVIAIAGRYNNVVSSSIPQGCVIEWRDEPISIAENIIVALGLDGNVNFDFKYDSQGHAQLIEINPRLSATITAYAPHGINFPYLRLKSLLGEPLPTFSVNEGVVMQRRYSEVFFDKDGSEIEWR